VARLISVSAGEPKTITWMGRTEMTGIWKTPLGGRVAVRGVNVAGDGQADPRAHGGPHKAVYAYAREDQQWWETALGRPMEPGIFGENLTVTGVDVTGAVIGERWAIGTVLFEVAQPRIPCWKLGARMNDPEFPRRFSLAGRPGAYLRIVNEGELGTGDEVLIVHRPDHGVTTGDVARIYLRDGDGAEKMLRAPQLPPKWHEWARERLARDKIAKRAEVHRATQG
jgi:MOSC domain-containing protein YiiM